MDYKLIKEYPGSPMLGKVVKQLKKVGTYKYEDINGEFYTKDYIESYPENWELINKANTIMTFKQFKKIMREVTDIKEVISLLYKYNRDILAKALREINNTSIGTSSTLFNIKGFMKDNWKLDDTK